MASGALAKAEAKLAGARARMAAIREENAETIEAVVGTAIAAGSGAVYGGLDEKFGEDAIFGTSVPLVGGLILTGIGLMGGAGGASFAVLEAGKAGLVVEAYKFGSRTAADWMRDDEESEGGEG